MTREQTAVVYERLRMNRREMRRVQREGLAVPQGLRLAVEHDEALLATEMHRREAERLEEATAVRAGRREAACRVLEWAVLTAAGVGVWCLGWWLGS